MTRTFAALLRRARRATRDPSRGGHLTQERFAELVSGHINRRGFPTSASVSNWERDVARPSSHDRIALYGIITVLVRCEGLPSFEAADALLIQGGYAPLTSEEAHHLCDNLPQAIGIGENNKQQICAEGDYVQPGKQTVMGLWE